MLKKIVMAIVLISMAALGASPELKAPDPKIHIAGDELIADAPAGHHFNQEAPAFLETGGKRAKPVRKTKGQMHFKLPPQGDSILSVYLCDEGNTFCKNHRLLLTLNEKNEIQMRRSTGVPDFL